MPEHILKSGVDALAQGRFVYRAPEPSVAVALAKLYVDRARWGRPLLLVAAVVTLAWLAWWLFVSGPAARTRDALPTALEDSYALLSAQAEGPLAVEQSAALLAEGRSALQRGDTEAAQRAIAGLEVLRRDVEAESGKP